MFKKNWHSNNSTQSWKMKFKEKHIVSRSREVFTLLLLWHMVRIRLVLKTNIRYNHSENSTIIWTHHSTWDRRVCSWTPGWHEGRWGRPWRPASPDPRWERPHGGASPEPCPGCTSTWSVTRQNQTTWSATRQNPSTWSVTRQHPSTWSVTRQNPST